MGTIQWYVRKFMHINKYLTVERIMIFGFMFIILTGAVLLSLPISSKTGEATSFLTSLFTATSATCVTGLVLVDTYSHWSFFGRMVILCLIQIGGLGFMSVMCIFFFITKKSIGLSERLLMVQSLSLTEISGVVKIVKHVLMGTFLIEGIGAILLAIRFSMDFGVVKGIGLGIFHSISAFCNAGFDLMGRRAPFSSITSYVSDPLINFTIMALIIIGGIGFFVWEDLWTKRSLKKLHLHSKLVLTMTAFLIVAGAIVFYAVERTNMATMGSMSTPDAILASLFQSVSPRTAGFNTIDQAGMTNVSKFFTIVLMFIGGSPGSTAGGIKTAAFSLIVLSTICTLQGKKRISVYGRSIPASQVLYAFSVMMTVLFAIFISTMLLSVFQDASLLDCLFETVSAIGTVGLSTGVTTTLVPASQVVIIFMMFFGRVGIMTIGMAAAINRRKAEPIKYPEQHILMG